jgi:hypothetical protein
MDPRVIISPLRLLGFSQRLGNQNVRIYNGMVAYYEDIEIGCQVWDDDFQPQFIDFDSTLLRTKDCSLQLRVRSCMNLAAMFEQRETHQRE